MLSFILSFWLPNIVVFSQWTIFSEHFFSEKVRPVMLIVKYKWKNRGQGQKMIKPANYAIVNKQFIQIWSDRTIFEYTVHYWVETCWTQKGLICTGISTGSAICLCSLPPIYIPHQIPIFPINSFKSCTFASSE